jgi:hypothetical protein
MKYNNKTFKIKYKKSKQKPHYSIKKYIKIKKVRNSTFKNRTQIGCSNKKKIMMGGGVNGLSQPFENLGYNIYDKIGGAYNTFFGHSLQPSSDVIIQPHLIKQ